MHFENDAVARAFFNAQHPSRQVLLVGPQVNERFFSGVPHFVLKVREPGQPLTVLANFNRARTHKFA
jgi:hypothetical protein